ncbi:hypothetical protein ARMGADRAFT_287567 [Armillaria gallica]|uniref:Uncharacterized protein n=1 Tax=Armillaria gallica TaxID=47427 RepID=A0A2H3D7A0_ARMGA|nr:hypothetical protein ARMGADRAFT_287567 [Armillaria gallica]
MGRARNSLNEILCRQTCPYSRPAPVATRLAHGAPSASLVSPKPTYFAIRVRHENLRIQTLSSLNHSPTSHRSLMVSPRQTVLCRSGLAPNIADPNAVLSLPWTLLFTDARGGQKLRLPRDEEARCIEIQLITGTASVIRINSAWMSIPDSVTPAISSNQSWT